MTGTTDIGILIGVVAGVLVAGFLLKTVLNGFVSVIFVVVVLYVVLAVWVPGPLEPVLLPVQAVLRIPFNLLGESLDFFTTLSVGSGGVHSAS